MKIYPQDQGSQNPLFLKLLNSSDLASSSSTDIRVYIVHGSTYAEEIDDMDGLQLRIQASYIFVKCLTKAVSHWNGKLATKQLIKDGNRIAEKIAELQNLSLSTSMFSSIKYAQIESND